MGKKPLEVLKNGLKQLKESVNTRKEDLLARLNQKEVISSADEEWLDQNANFVDEEALIDSLENVSDYEGQLSKLDERQKLMVEKLMELGGGIKDNVVMGTKRKRPVERKKPVEKRKAEPVFTKKENATLAQRIEILDWYHTESGTMKSQVKTAAHFNKIYPNLRIKQPLLSSWIKDEKKWREKCKEEQALGKTGVLKRAKQTEHPEVNEMLELWVCKAMSDGLQVTGEVLRQKWMQFANLEKIPADERLTLSEGWLTAFKKRCGLKEFRRHGEAGSVHPSHVEAERERVRELIRKYGYQLKDIFNMDETGLFYAMPPDRGLMTKATAGLKGNKTRLTYAFTANADGSEKLPAFIIGKAARPRAFKKKTGAQLGFYYRNNAKAWMTAILYQEWLQDWDNKLRQKDRKILLLQDNFSGHIVPNNLTNISIENFQPNLTPHVQPNDAGIIRCFKAHYRSKFISRAIDRYDNQITPANIYDIDQLEAMRLTALAWNEVDTTTIRNCWRKTGILPNQTNTSQADVPVALPSIPISALLSEPAPVQVNATESIEREIDDALSELEKRGVLSKVNRMAIDELLNPEPEQHIISPTTTDQEIADAVHDRRAGVEMMGLNGGDDTDSDVVETPSYRDALAASLTLQQYITDMQDPYARKLEAILAGFGHRLRLEESRTLRSSCITDYFTSDRT